MGKLSVVLKNDDNLMQLCRFFPSAWPKLCRTSRLFVWRLDAQKLQVMQQRLIEEMHLVYLDLHESCERGDAERVWVLLSNGISAKLRDAQGATLLQKAVHSGRTALLRLLCEKGGSVNAKGAYGYTPLHEDCYIGHEAVASTLLSLKANVDALSKNGSTPLLIASREGHVAVVKELLRHRADANDGGDKGWTPLAVAAGEGHVEVVKVLLDNEASVHGFLGDAKVERSALHEAAEQGHEQVVSMLLRFKADVNHKFDEYPGCGVTAYDLAARNNHSKVASLLMDAQGSAGGDGL